MCCRRSWLWLLVRVFALVLHQSGNISREEFMLNKKALAEVERDALFAKEDKDSDGIVSWDEFTGPKGDVPPMCVPRSSNWHLLAPASFRPLVFRSGGFVERRHLPFRCLTCA